MCLCRKLARPGVDYSAIDTSGVTTSVVRVSTASFPPPLFSPRRPSSYLIDLLCIVCCCAHPCTMASTTTIFGVLYRYGGQARPTGRVQLLTHLAYLGYCFNPVSFYYCLDASEKEIETVVAEVRILLVFCVSVVDICRCSKVDGVKGTGG